LAIADDQFALALADGDEGVDRANTGLQRLLHGLAFDHGRRGVFDRAIALGDDLAFAVDGVSERVDHAAEQRFADGHRRDATRPPDLLTFFDVGIGAEDDDADVVLFEVERDALQAVLKFDEFRLLDGFEAVHACDARADLDDRSDLIFVNFALKVLDLAF
jgi:hypothetical protein